MAVCGMTALCMRAERALRQSAVMGPRSLWLASWTRVNIVHVQGNKCSVIGAVMKSTLRAELTCG